jgi:hypothetical protein
VTSEIFLTIDESLRYMSAALKNRGVRGVIGSENFFN